jgi:transposase
LFKVLGKDVSEQLKSIAAAFKVIRIVRSKRACVGCDRIVQAPASSSPIERGITGSGLLAQILMSKFANHQPLYRKAAIYVRAIVELDCSTIARWICACCSLMCPLVEALQRYVL